jgi:DnaJ family protein C protein 3
MAQGARLILLCAALTLLTCGVDAKKKASVPKLRSDGDMAFAKGDMKKAKKLFKKVIKLEPKNERNYYKLFRVHLKERAYPEAIKDLTKALEVAPKYKEGLYQRGHLNIQMGHCVEASADLDTLLQIDPAHKKGLVDAPLAKQCAQSVQQAESHATAGNHKAAHEHYSAALSHTTNSHKLLLERGKSCFAMGEYFETLADTGRALKIEKESMEALEMRGMAYYKLGEHDMALRHFRQGLHYDPDHKGCKTIYKKLKKIDKLEKNGDKALAEGKHDEAIVFYTDSIAVDPEHSVFVKEVYFKICNAHLNAEAMAEGAETTRAQSALEAGMQATAADDSFANGHMCVSDAYMKLEQFEDAVQAIKNAHNHNQEDGGIREKVQKAEAALKQSKTKNYYKILGVERDVNDRGLKKAYRKLALKWHPDKHPGEESQKKAAAMFQDIGEAHEVLSKPELRAKYDKGEDVFDNQGGGGGGGGGRMFHHGGQQFKFHFGF